MAILSYLPNISLSNVTFLINWHDQWCMSHQTSTIQRRARCRVTEGSSAWTHARWGSVPLLPKARFICSQGAVIRTCISQEPPLGQRPCWGTRETQSHSGDLIWGGKRAKPKVNKPNDERSAMKAIHECQSREKGSVLDRRVRKRQPEALVFTLRLTECENWGRGSEGRDHEQTPGWEKSLAVLGNWTQMAGLRLGRGRGRGSEKWVRRALLRRWGPQWGFEASSREATWSDLHFEKTVIAMRL